LFFEQEVSTADLLRMSRGLGYADYADISNSPQPIRVIRVIRGQSGFGCGYAALCVSVVQQTSTESYRLKP
jgi:hypothetical protein